MGEQLAAHLLRVELALKAGEQLGEAAQFHPEIREGSELFFIQPRFCRLAHRQQDFAVLQLQITQAFAQFQRIRRFLQGGVFTIIDEAEQLPCRKTVAEKMDGGLRQVVRFVNHKCLNIRQDFRKSLAFQGKIGQQQVMVDNHHIRFLRLLPRLLQIAFFVKRAVAAKTVLNRRGDARQHRRIFRHFFQADQIAVSRRIKKMLNGAALPLVRRRRAVIIKILVIVMVAEVIAPPFQQRDAGHAAQHLAHQRQILAVNLFLQIARGGGYQPLAAGGQ